MRVSVLDYGVGNVPSIRNMLEYLGYETRVAITSKDVQQSQVLIIPGVGAFDAAIAELDRRDGLRQSVIEFSLEREGPTLGICLGAQLLMSGSEEGNLKGLGLIPGTTRKLREHQGLKVPHVGWNFVRPRAPSHLLGSDYDTRFYFVHSFALHPEDSSDILGETTHGDDFASVIRRGRVIGAQFHPEKSHKNGMEFFRRALGSLSE